MYKILKTQSPKYLFDLIPMPNTSYMTRNNHQLNIPLLKVKNKFFENSFLPSAVIEWNKLDLSIRNSLSYALFRKSLLVFIRPSENSIYGVNNPKGVILLHRLRVGLSHLRKHKFDHGFLDTLNPICSCGQDIESLNHFFLHCPHYLAERQTLLHNIERIIPNKMKESDNEVTHLLLYGENSFTSLINREILNSSIEYILNTKRFDNPLILES